MTNTPTNEPVPVLETAAQKRAEEDQRRTQRKAFQRVAAQWGKEHASRMAKLMQELLALSPDPAADEALLTRLAANSTVLAELLGRAQLQLASRIERLLDEPKLLMAVARSLREVSGVQNATARSVQELLSAAGTIRAQRALVAHHTKRTWHEQVGGGSFDSSRRDQARGRPEAN